MISRPSPLAFRDDGRKVTVGRSILLDSSRPRGETSQPRESKGGDPIRQRSGRMRVIGQHCRPMAKLVVRQSWPRYV
jgi:hypothetical protein